MTLTQGGVYLARLDPAKHVEIEKIRPVVILMGQFTLQVVASYLFEETPLFIIS